MATTPQSGARASSSWIRGWKVANGTLDAIGIRIGDQWTRPERWERQPEPSPGLFVFGAFDAQLVDQVQSLALEGSRVIALSVSLEPLTREHMFG